MTIAQGALTGIHLSYVRAQYNREGELWYAYDNGQGWVHTNTLIADVRDTSIGVWPSDGGTSMRQEIAFVTEEGVLGLAYPVGSEWRSYSLDNQVRTRDISLAYSPAVWHYPAVAYVDVNDDLQFAAYTDNGWTKQEIPTTPNRAYEISGPVLAFSPIPPYQPFVLYGEVDSGLLHLAQWTGTEWQDDVIGGTGNTIAKMDMVIDSSGHPHVIASNWRETRYGRPNALGQWSPDVWEVLYEGQTSASAAVAIGLNYADKPVVAFSQDDKLFYMWLDGVRTRWNAKIVDTATNIPRIVLDLDSDNRSAIAYHIWTTSTARVARQAEMLIGAYVPLAAGFEP